MAQPVRRHQAAIADAASEARLLRPEQLPRTAEWMPSAPTSTSATTRAPFSNSRFDAVAVVREAGEAMPEMQPLRSARRWHSSVQQIGAMRLVVRKAESRLDRRRPSGVRSSVRPSSQRR